MPNEHPPPPPPPGNMGATLEYIDSVLKGNYSEEDKLKAIGKAVK